MIDNKICSVEDAMTIIKIAVRQANIPDKKKPGFEKSLTRIFLAGYQLGKDGCTKMEV